MQRVKEGFDARAISVIRRRPVKCSGETAQLVTHAISTSFSWAGLLQMLPVKTQMSPTIHAFSKAPTMRAHTTFIHQHLELKPTG